MNILVALDSNYIHPLKVMLKSLFLNNPGEHFRIYLMQSAIPERQLENLSRFVEEDGQKLEIVKMEQDLFQDAPVILHYTREMYYRLLAYKILPADITRILYLDPDILAINPVRELYETDLEGYLFAAAYHDVLPNREINKIRLKSPEMKAYYNSGVLMMNLELQRKEISEQMVFDFVEKNRVKLIMPDQDIINALYASKIKTLDEKRYNYDARYYYYYKIMTNGMCDMDYIIRNTVFLHFCGKKKPWCKNYGGKFHSLYKHYEKIADCPAKYGTGPEKLWKQEK